MNNDFRYIQSYYGVPASKGQRVEYTNWQGIKTVGKIIGARGQYIKIHFDGHEKPHNGVFHPTDGMRYLTDDKETYDSQRGLESAASPHQQL